MLSEIFLSLCFLIVIFVFFGIYGFLVSQCHNICFKSLIIYGINDFFSYFGNFYFLLVFLISFFYFLFFNIFIHLLLLFFLLFPHPLLFSSDFLSCCEYFIFFLSSLAFLLFLQLIIILFFVS